ncbi:MAG: DUF3365 domain-containing protein [Deltaproteobacteria bacterium]|nr:DUF3365 domain-containing protein [Deltaproteobacteria bacterium]
MKTEKIISAIVVIMSFFAFITNAFAGSEDDIARKLAIALVSGRAIVAQSQDLINDPAKGDKGLTPEVFFDKVVADYKNRTGVDLKAIKPDSELNKLLLAYVESMKEVLADAQELINKEGMAFKGFIPAVYGKKVGDKFTSKTGIRLKQTSDKYRNTANKPDEYEANLIAKFKEPGYKKGEGHGEAVDIGGRKFYRYMLPLYIEKPCLKCHGDPAGEKDIAGRIKEGYKEGDVRGGISVIIPVK